jgi:hypothetical protein
VSLPISPPSSLPPLVATPSLLPPHPCCHPIPAATPSLLPPHPCCHPIPAAFLDSFTHLCSPSHRHQVNVGHHLVRRLSSLSLPPAVRWTTHLAAAVAEQETALSVTIAQGVLARVGLLPILRAVQSFEWGSSSTPMCCTPGLQLEDLKDPLNALHATVYESLPLPSLSGVLAPSGRERVRKGVSRQVAAAFQELHAALLREEAGYGREEALGVLRHTPAEVSTMLSGV